MNMIFVYDWTFKKNYFWINTSEKKKLPSSSQNFQFKYSFTLSCWHVERFNICGILSWKFFSSVPHVKNVFSF